MSRAASLALYRPHRQQFVEGLGEPATLRTVSVLEDGYLHDLVLETLSREEDRGFGEVWRITPGYECAKLFPSRMQHLREWAPQQALDDLHDRLQAAPERPPVLLWLKDHGDGLGEPAVPTSRLIVSDPVT